MVDALEQTIRGNPVNIKNIRFLLIEIIDDAFQISSKYLQELCSRMLENKENHNRNVSNSHSPTGRAPDDPEPTSAISTAAPSM